MEHDNTVIASLLDTTKKMNKYNPNNNKSKIALSSGRFYPMEALIAPIQFAAFNW